MPLLDANRSAPARVRRRPRPQPATVVPPRPFSDAERRRAERFKRTRQYRRDVQAARPRTGPMHQRTPTRPLGRDPFEQYQDEAQRRARRAARARPDAVLNLPILRNPTRAQQKQIRKLQEDRAVFEAIRRGVASRAAARTYGEVRLPDTLRRLRFESSPRQRAQIRQLERVARVLDEADAKAWARRPRAAVGLAALAGGLPKQQRQAGGLRVAGVKRGGVADKALRAAADPRLAPLRAIGAAQKA